METPHKKIEKLNSRHRNTTVIKISGSRCQNPTKQAHVSLFSQKINKKSNSKSTKRFTSPDKAKLELQPHVNLRHQANNSQTVEIREGNPTER